MKLTIERGGHPFPDISVQHTAENIFIWVTSIPNTQLFSQESVGEAGASTFAHVLLRFLHLEGTQLVKVGPIIRKKMAELSNSEYKTSYTAETIPDEVVAHLRKELKSAFDKKIDSAMLFVALEQMQKYGVVIVEGKVVGIAREKLHIVLPPNTVELRIGVYADALVAARRTQERFKQQTGTILTLEQAQKIRKERFTSDKKADKDAYNIPYSGTFMRSVVHYIADSSHTSAQDLVVALQSRMVSDQPTLHEKMFTDHK